MDSVRLGRRHNFIIGNELHRWGSIDEMARFLHPHVQEEEIWRNDGQTPIALRDEWSILRLGGERAVMK